MDKVPQRRDDFIWRVIDGEAFILSDTGRKIITLNKVASFIWQQCDGSRTVQEILSSLLECFEVDKIQAEQDLTALINEMYKEKIIGFK